VPNQKEKQIFEDLLLSDTSLSVFVAAGNEFFGVETNNKVLIFRAGRDVKQP
jgi:hypothetical protein